jgi:hypothetical protein
MAFVPEGQHDSSQARSAWNHEENSRVPAGRMNRSQLRTAMGKERELFVQQRHRVGKKQAKLFDWARILDPHSPIPEALPRFSVPTAGLRLNFGLVVPVKDSLQNSPLIDRQWRVQDIRQRALALWSRNKGCFLTIEVPGQVRDLFRKFQIKVKTNAFYRNKIRFDTPKKDGIQLTAAVVFGLLCFLVSFAD